MSKAREIAELLSRLSEHGDRRAVMRFIRDVGSSLSRDRRPGGGGGGGDGGSRFSRRDLAGIFRRVRERPGGVGRRERGREGGREGKKDGQQTKDTNGQK